MGNHSTVSAPPSSTPTLTPAYRRRSQRNTTNWYRSQNQPFHGLPPSLLARLQMPETHIPAPVAPRRAPPSIEIPLHLLRLPPSPSPIRHPSSIASDNLSNSSGRFSRIPIRIQDAPRAQAGPLNTIIEEIAEVVDQHFIDRNFSNPKSEEHTPPIASTSQWQLDVIIPVQLPPLPTLPTIPGSNRAHHGQS